MANPHTSRPGSVSNWQNFAAVALAGIFTTVLLAPHSARAQTETVLYSFKGGPTDGKTPYAGVIRDKAGNLYGTTLYGGARDKGTVFKLTSSRERLLHSFGGSPDGDSPVAALKETPSATYMVRPRLAGLTAGEPCSNSTPEARKP